MKRAVLFLILILTGCVPMQSRVYPTATPTPEMLIVRRSDPTPRANPTPYIPGVNYMATIMADSPELIYLDGVSRGAYGRTVVTNDGTPNRLEYIGYFVPTGRYTARNERDYPDGLNVYSSKTIWDGGVEYPADTKSYRFTQIGETQEITVPEGYYIKVIPPTSFSLTALR